MLALNGEKDTQVPPTENLLAIEEALREGGNPDVTAEVLPGLNHLFQTAVTGSPAEYAGIEETFSPAALGEDRRLDPREGRNSIDRPDASAAPRG